MIPLRDVVPSRTFPAVTVAIIAANLAALGYGWWLGSPSHAAFLTAYGIVPGQFSFLALPTSLFVHANVLQAAATMIYLWIFGENVEDRVGHGRFLLLYLLCGTAAATAQLLMHPASVAPIVGAGGAVAGVMGAYVVLYPGSKIVTLLPLVITIRLVEIPAIFFLGLWLVLAFLGGMGALGGAATAEPIGGVAFWGHVIAFVTGAAGVLLLRRPERLRVEWWDVTRA